MPSPPHHPDRRPTRLKGYDYTRGGYYFVTICTHGREPIFGAVKNGHMELNEWGQIAHNQMLWLANQFHGVNLDEFIVMPDHVHAIIIIKSYVGAGRDPPGMPDRSEHRTGHDLSLQCNNPKIKSLPQIIGAYKTTSSKSIRTTYPSFTWQRSFHDHIIRDDADLNRIRAYIRNNPLKWSLGEDELHP